MRILLSILAALSIGAAHAQSDPDARVQDAGLAGELRRPANAIETDILNRIKTAILSHRDGAAADETVDAAFQTFGVNSVRLTDDAAVLVDLTPRQAVSEADLPKLHDDIVVSLRDTRPFDATSPPRVTLYISGAPAYEAVCKDQESYAKDNTRPLPGKDLLAINAAHGVYLHYPRNSKPVWTTQRGEQNGIVEDFITPVFAARLHGILSVERPGGDARVRLIRQAFPSKHEASGRNWIDLAGRYALQRTMPGKTDVWGFSCRNPDDIANDPLREKYYDTSSRSRFANAIGADGIIHLHTNADCRPLRRGEARARGGACPRGQTVNAEATGMAIFYAPTSTVSKTLSELIACTAKQTLAAEYPSYRIVPPSPRTDLAELFLARKASVVVEVGFHTNPSDAALLKSEAFQQKSMEAIAKAWRQYVNGERCG